MSTIAEAVGDMVVDHIKKQTQFTVDGPDFELSSPDSIGLMLYILFLKVQFTEKRNPGWRFSSASVHPVENNGSGQKDCHYIQLHFLPKGV